VSEGPGCRAHKLVADVAVLSEDRVLLVRYRDVGRYDGQRGWFLPDDFLDHLEHPDTAAGRILSEQAGLSPEVRLDHIESFGDGAWHLIFHYRAALPEAVAVRGGENVAAAEWFPLGALPDDAEMAHEGWAREVLEAMGCITAGG
jgi:ADP-ribose pyrophosphatase YjhB (NUDIX family)